MVIGTLIALGLFISLIGFGCIVMAANNEEDDE